jgi:hypothetical protein
MLDWITLTLGRVVPSSGSDASSSSYLRESPRLASPLDRHGAAERDKSRSRSPAPGRTTALWDDPRSTHFEAPLLKWDPAVYPRRPDLLKHKTDDGSSRTLSPGQKIRSPERKDQGVRVNVFANRKGAGRVGAMVKGPDDKYAIGGAMGEPQIKSAKQ